ELLTDTDPGVDRRSPGGTSPSGSPADHRSTRAVRQPGARLVRSRGTEPGTPPTRGARLDGGAGGAPGPRTATRARSPQRSGGEAVVPHARDGSGERA